MWKFFQINIRNSFKHRTKTEEIFNTNEFMYLAIVNLANIVSLLILSSLSTIPIITFPEKSSAFSWISWQNLCLSSGVVSISSYK